MMYVIYYGHSHSLSKAEGLSWTKLSDEVWSGIWTTCVFVVASGQSDEGRCVLWAANEQPTDDEQADGHTVTPRALVLRRESVTCTGTLKEVKEGRGSKETYEYNIDAKHSIV
jgi:hypothetical protein